MLTQHQADILQQGLSMLSTNKILLIKGSAGVGKTFLVNELIKKLPNKSGKTVFCTAPTHKALEVLRNKISTPCKFYTVQAALSITRKIDPKTGEKFFKQDDTVKIIPIMDASAIVVDEASMIGTYVLKRLEFYSQVLDLPIIFLGDEKQLPPIEDDMTISPVFTRDYPAVELTEIVRQQNGNPIIHLSRNLQTIPKKVENVVPQDDNFLGYTYSNDLDRVLYSLAEANGSPKIKYLAFTNKEVDRINKFVRERIYNNPNKIERGETLVFNAPYNSGSYHTSEEIVVNTLSVETRSFSVPDRYNEYGAIAFKSVEFTFYHINKKIDGTDGVLVIHESSEKNFSMYNTILKTKALRKEISWLSYHLFIEQFADLHYNHALTIHKSQGSTFDNVIVNYKNIMFDKDKDRRDKLLYTAITRPSKLLIFYNI